MRYAEISVNSPAAQRRTFCYSIPAHLPVVPGQAVLVPFGEKVLQGIVIELSDTPAVEETRDILDILDPQPILSPTQIKLARWLSDYYLSPLFDAVALMLPPGFERKPLTFLWYQPADNISSLTSEQQSLTNYVKESGRTDQRALEKKFGKKKADALISQLVRKGFLTRQYELEPVKMKPKTVPFLKLIIPAEQAKEFVAGLKAKSIKKSPEFYSQPPLSKAVDSTHSLSPCGRDVSEGYSLPSPSPSLSSQGRGIDLTSSRITPKQLSLLTFLIEHPEPMPWSEVMHAAGATKAAADELVKRGVATFELVEVSREPFNWKKSAQSPPLTPTPAQESALAAIRGALREGKPTVFLLHGVTGSGKTEVYLQALAEAVKLGKKGTALVPEIALTPQTIERFAARFPQRVAVLHSRLSPGIQYDEWRRIKAGNVDVVIGPRSALFAPLTNPGIIIIDEEHEWSYKQEDMHPHYHARDAALKLVELTGAVVVLGSATPDVCSYYSALNGSYRLLRLPERVGEGSMLPPVDIVDMREELKSGNRSIFSRSLSQAIAAALSHHEQVILFLNRRGGATFVLCRHCGFVLCCRRCDVPLTYHVAEDRMVCHQCNYKVAVPSTCPRCCNRQLQYLGAGTQKLEEETRALFPHAHLLRWDSDSTASREAHEEILGKFRSQEADILIGTQMVAKGLDVPSVTLVGVISADTSLNLPDFRSGERTFQLLSQVAGRAGRGVLGGRVIIQTFSPDHYAIQAASRHNYAAFYEQEITYRRQFRNPPFSQLALLTFSHPYDARGQQEADHMKQLLTQERDARGIADIAFIGPAPAFIHRLRGMYRWQLILRGSNLSSFLSSVTVPRGWQVDIDPMNLL